MKRIICFPIFLLLAGQLLQAQELTQKKYIVYLTSIQDVRGNHHMGYIATMDDTTIMLSRKKFALTFENLDPKYLQKFGYTDIVRVDLHSKANEKRSVLTGAAIGVVVGGLIGCSSANSSGGGHIGYSFSPNCTPLQGGLVGAAIGAGLGCLVGALCGHSHQVFRINRKKDKLADMRETMLRTLY